MERPARHPWRRRLLAALGLAALLVVAGGAWLLWPRPPTAITEQDALEQFRGTTTGRASTEVVGPSPGVYTYDADGTEDISMGPLPLPTRDVPSTVTVVVNPAGDGCFTTTLNLMGEHTETTTWCTDEGALVLSRQDKQEQVPGFDVAAETVCDPGTVLAPERAELPVRCRLEMDVSGLALGVDLVGSATVEPVEAVPVDGRPVEVRHLTLELTATGDLAGHWIEEHWLTDDLLSVRIVRDVVLDGPGSFDEQTTLTLRGLVPRT